MDGVITLTYKGKTQTLREWEKETGISRNTLYSRVYSGWSAEKVFETPIIEYRKDYREDNLRTLYEYIIRTKRRHDGAPPTYRDISEEFGISTSQAKYWVEDLESMGLITTSSSTRARSIEVVGARWIAPDINLERVFENADEEL